MTPDPSGAAPQDVVADVKRALQQASAWGGPRSNLALVTHWPEWLGALVQLVEDQQAQVRLAEFNARTIAEERDRATSEVAGLRADGQRLREALSSAVEVARWAAQHGLMFSSKAADEWAALASPRNE